MPAPSRAEEEDDGPEQMPDMQRETGLVVRKVRALSPARDSRGAPSYRRGVKIGAELGTWDWLIEHAYASPGIVFEALADSWMLTAELVGDHLEFRNYRLK